MTTTSETIGRAGPASSAPPVDAALDDDHVDLSRPLISAAGIASVWSRPSASDLLAFALLLWMLAMVGWSVHLARWGDLPNIVPTAMMACTAAFVMSRLRISWVLKLGFFAAAGFAIVAWQGGLRADGANVFERASDAWARMELWIDVAVNGGVSGDTVPFALIFMATTWVVGYAVSALTFRTLSPWVPVLILGLSLLTNLSHRHGQFEYTFYLFVIGATAQFAHLVAVGRTRRWEAQGLKAPRGARWHSARDGVVLGGVIVLIAALSPLFEITSGTLERRWNAVFLNPFLSLRSTAERLLAGIPSGQGALLDAPKPVLPFQGPVNLTDEPLFRVRSRYAKMHPGRVYQEYTSQGWISAPVVRLPAPANVTLEADAAYRGLLYRELVEIAVQPAGASNLVVPAASVRSVNLPTEVDVLVPMAWELPLTGPPELVESLPEDLREFGIALRYELLAIANQIETVDGTRYTLATQPAMDRRAVIDAVRNLRASDSNIPWEQFSYNFALTEDGNGIGSARLLRNAPAEHNTVVLAQPAVANQQFLVNTSVSTATDTELRNAIAEYPKHVTDRYLQLPITIPTRVLRLADRIVFDASAVTAWEKAQAIKAFLQDQVYSLEIEGPDPRVDAIDYFLFSTVDEPCPSDDRDCDRSKIKGYSQYYGSAATVLLRAVDVPARFVAGWGTGEYLPSEGQFLIRDRNRHGWTQIYLAPFGWIDLEVTPGRAAVPRNLRVPTTPIEEVPGPVVGSSEFDDDFMAALEYLESLALNPQIPADLPDLGQADGGAGNDLNPPWIVLGASGTALLAIIALWLAWRWSLRGQDAAIKAYTQWVRVAALLGYRRPSHLSAREYGAQLGSLDRATRARAELLVDRYEVSRYGAGSDRTATSDGARAATAQLRSAWRGAAMALFRHRVRRIFRQGDALSIG